MAISSRSALLVLLGPLFLSTAPTWARPPESAAILTKVDYLLNPKGSYDYQATATVHRGKSPVQELALQVSVQDPLRRRITVEMPAAEAGKSLLLDGEKLWLYIPKLEKAVRIPPQVEFAGEISSADLAQPFFSMVYQTAGMETAEWQGTPAYVLKLVPRSKTGVYSKVKLWIGQDDFRPLQAEFFGERNVLAKTCFYEDFVEELGAKRPLRWVYRDAADPENETVLAMKKMTRKNFDPAAFEPKASPKLFNFPEARPKSASDPIPPRRRAGQPLP